MNHDLIQRLIEHEGFHPRPYPDPLSGGKPWTFGHGLTYLTKEESLMVVHLRLASIHEKLHARKPFFDQLPLEVQLVLVEMAYQMGIGGLMNFKNTWKHLENQDFNRASQEMLDSQWAKTQTPSRAQNLSKIIAKAAHNDT